MTVKWDKNENADGYEIQYTTGSTTKKVTVTGAGTVSRTISSLTKGKTCSVRVRAYKAVGFRTYFGAWSAKKSITISK